MCISWTKVFKGKYFSLPAESKPHGLALQEDIWDADVDLHQKLLRRWKELKEHTGHKYACPRLAFSDRVELAVPRRLFMQRHKRSSILVKGLKPSLKSTQTFRRTCKQKWRHSWPGLPWSTPPNIFCSLWPTQMAPLWVRTIRFLLLPVRRHVQGYFKARLRLKVFPQDELVTLQNPADVPIYVQVLPLALMPNPSVFSGKLADRWDVPTDRGSVRVSLPSFFSDADLFLISQVAVREFVQHQHRC